MIAEFDIGKAVTIRLVSAHFTALFILATAGRWVAVRVLRASRVHASDR